MTDWERLGIAMEEFKAGIRAEIGSVLKALRPLLAWAIRYGLICEDADRQIDRSD